MTLHDDGSMPSSEINTTEAEAKARRKTLIQLFISVGLLVVLFAFVLPSLIDYGVVWEVFRSLDAATFGWLIVLALLRLAFEAMLYSAVIPGLGIRDGISSYLASNTVAEIAPPPADLAVRFGMYKSLGIDTEPAGVGIILSGVFSMGARLLLPVLALLAVVATGPADEETWILLAIGLSAVGGAGLFVTMIMRSEALTLRVGDWVGRAAERIARRFNKPIDSSNLGTRAVGFRSKISSTLAGRWPYATGAVVMSHVFSFAIVVVSMRFVGITGDVVDWVDLLVAYAIVRLITLIPLTPGGIGVAAVGYVYLLGAGNDPALANLIAAASFLTRIFVWLVPLIVGIPPFLLWRKKSQKV